LGQWKARSGDVDNFDLKATFEKSRLERTQILEGKVGKNNRC
jgi:hypothetical protein